MPVSHAIYGQPTQSPKQFSGCAICGRCFRQHQSLVNHVVRVHVVDWDRPECPICHAGFRSGIELRKHVGEKHSMVDDKPRQRKPTRKRGEKCNICGKEFTQVESLDLHKAQSHLLTQSSTVKPCEICYTKFTSSQTLRLHYRMVHKEEMMLLL